MFSSTGSVNLRVRGMLISYCFSDFLMKESMILYYQKSIVFNLLIKDIPIYVICKFEMPTFKSVQVIKYYVMFGFLFVQTVYIIHIQFSHAQYQKREIVTATLFSFNSCLPIGRILSHTVSTR